MRRPRMCFDKDVTGELSDPTTLWSYHRLSEARETRIDMLGRAHLDETSGTVDCVVAGGPAGTDLSVADFPGGGAPFTLQNRSVADWWSGGTAWSLSLWLRLDTDPGAGVPYALVGRQADDGTGWHLGANHYTSPDRIAPYLWTRSGGSNTFAEGDQNFAVATWYHLVCTFSGTTAKLYVNAGTPFTNAAMNGVGASGTGTALRLGRESQAAAPKYLDGRLCHLAMWRGVALSAARVTELYNSGAPNVLRWAA